MLTIAICDDEQKITSQIESFLFVLSQKQEIVLETDVFYSGHALEQQIFGGKRYDLIYLDIQMENGDGIAAEYGIAFCLQLCVPETLAVAPRDLGMVIGNALDNAITAVKECELTEKVISI